MDDTNEQKFFADELDTLRDTSIADISYINPDTTINYHTADEDDSRYFSVIEDESTLESVKEKDITCNIDSEQSTITDLPCEKSPEKIEPASILSSGVDIFDDNESSVDGHELVIDDDRQPSERSDDFLESGTEMSADMQYKYDVDVPDNVSGKNINFGILKNSCFQNNTVEENDNTAASLEINDVESSDSQSKIDFKDFLSDSEGSGIKVDNYNLPEGSHRVTFQIDGNNVEAINIGQDIYIYTDSNGALTAFQVIKEDGNCSMKYLHVGKNEDGNIEVYEEQISNEDFETTKEKTLIKDNLLADENEQSKHISVNMEKNPEHLIEVDTNEEKKSLSKNELPIADITVVKCDLNDIDLSANMQDILNGNSGIKTGNSNFKVEELNKVECVSSVEKCKDINEKEDDDVKKINNVDNYELIKIDQSIANLKRDTESIETLPNKEKINEELSKTSEQEIQINSISVKGNKAGLDKCEKMEFEHKKDVVLFNELQTREDNQTEINGKKSNLVKCESDLGVDLQSKLLKSNTKKDHFGSNYTNDLLNKKPKSVSDDLVLQTSSSLNVFNDLDVNMESISPLKKFNNEEHATKVLKHVAMHEAVREASIDNINSNIAQNSKHANNKNEKESDVSQITCKTINLDEKSDIIKLNIYDDKVSSPITSKDIVINETGETHKAIIEDIVDENLKSGNITNNAVDLDVESDEDMDDVVEGEPVTGDSEIYWLDDEYSKEKTDIANVGEDCVEDLQQPSEVKCVINDVIESKEQSKIEINSEVENVIKENVENIHQTGTEEQLDNTINNVDNVESLEKQTSIEINSETEIITDIKDNGQPDIEVEHTTKNNAELFQQTSIDTKQGQHIACELLEKSKDECKNTDSHSNKTELLVDQTVSTNIEVNNVKEETCTVSMHLFEETNDVDVNSVAILEDTSAVAVSQEKIKSVSTVQNEELDLCDHPMRPVNSNNIRSYIAKKFKTLKSSGTSETGNPKCDVLSNEKIHTSSLSDNMLNSAKDSMPKIDVNILGSPNMHNIETHSKNILGEYIESHTANPENSIVLQSSNLNLQIVNSPLLIVTDSNTIVPVLENYPIEDNTASKIEVTNCNILNTQKSPTEPSCETMPKNKHRQPRKQIFTPVARSDIEMIFPDTDDMNNELITRHKPKCYSKSKSKSESDNSIIFKSTVDTEKTNNKKDAHKTNIKSGGSEVDKNQLKNPQYSREYNEKIISTNTEKNFEHTSIGKENDKSIIVVESNTDAFLNNRKVDVDTSPAKDNKDIEVLKNEKDVNVTLVGKEENKELLTSNEEILGSCESVKNTTDMKVSNGDTINVTPNSAKRKRGRPKKAVSTDSSTFESLIFNVDGSPSKITIDSYSHHNSFTETKITSPTKETVIHIDENSSQNEDEKLNVSLSDSDKKKKGRPRKLLSASLSDIDKIDAKANSSFKNLSLCNDDKIANLHISKSDENMNESSSINIDENICPICSKNFRSKNVLLKHAKHCNGVISVDVYKSPKKRKLEFDDNKTKSEIKVNEINSEKCKVEISEKHIKSDDSKLQNIVEKQDGNNGKVSELINASCEIIDEASNTNSSTEIIVIEDSVSNSPNPTMVSEKVDKNIEKSPKQVIPKEKKRIINKLKNTIVSASSEKNVKRDVAPSPMTRLSKILRTKCPINIIKCEVCGKIFKQLAHKISHKKKFHPETNKAPANILQKVPSIETENNRKIKESNHCSESEAILKCETCNKGFRKLHHLVEHRELHISNEIKSRRTSIASVKSEPEGGFRCEACGKSFRKLHHLVEHRELHSSDNNAEQNLRQSKTETKEVAEENTTCSCGKTFRKRYHMIEHRDIHCSPNKIRKENDDISSRDNNVRLSFTSSTSEDSNNCGICGKSYRKLHHMVEHRESHTGAESKESVDRIGSLGALNTKDIIHECARCYMVFPNINSLNKHTAICLNKKVIRKVLNLESNTDKSTSITTRRKSSISVTSSLSINTNKSEATKSARSSRTPESRIKPTKVPIKSTSKIPLVSNSKKVETSDDEESDVRYKINTDFNIRYKINPAFRRNSIASRKSINLQPKAPVTKLRRSDVPTSSVRKSIDKKEAKLLEIYEENVVRYSFPKPLNSNSSSNVVTRNSKVTKSSNSSKKSVVTVNPQKLETRMSITKRKDARKIHKCDCGKSFENDIVLKRHIDNEHTPPKSFKCQKCGVLLRTAVQYTKHKIAHETENKNHPNVQVVAGTSKTKKLVKCVSSDESQSKTPSTGKRRTTLHSGVPLSDKMKKAIANANFKI